MRRINYFKRKGQAGEVSDYEIFERIRDEIESLLEIFEEELYKVIPKSPREVDDIIGIIRTKMEERGISLEEAMDDEIIQGIIRDHFRSMIEGLAKW